MDNGFSAHGGSIIFRFEEIRVAVSGGDRNHNKFTRTETQKLHDFFFTIISSMQLSFDIFLYLGVAATWMQQCWPALHSLVPTCSLWRSLLLTLQPIG